MRERWVTLLLAAAAAAALYGLFLRKRVGVGAPGTLP